MGESCIHGGARASGRWDRCLLARGGRTWRGVAPVGSGGRRPLATPRRGRGRKRTRVARIGQHGPMRAWRRSGTRI